MLATAPQYSSIILVLLRRGLILILSTCFFFIVFMNPTDEMQLAIDGLVTMFFVTGSKTNHLDQTLPVFIQE